MSRSGYSEDCENLDLWRRSVENSIRGKRGQAFLGELIASLDEMPEKRLIAESLIEAPTGHVCALGAVGRRRGLDLEPLDPEDPWSVAKTFGIATCLAQEIVYENDECGGNETPEQRWTRVRAWAAENMLETHKPGEDT